MRGNDHVFRQARLQAGGGQVHPAPERRAVGNFVHLDIVVTAILVQRTVGGNLSEILTNVSETIRGRFELRQEIKTLTTRQNLTASFTAALPIIVAVLFIAINPDLGDLLINTTAGRVALSIGAGFELLGVLLVRRFARVEV